MISAAIGVVLLIVTIIIVVTSHKSDGGGDDPNPPGPGPGPVPPIGPSFNPYNLKEGSLSDDGKNIKGILSADQSQYENLSTH